jgi:hypothetical protein
MTLSPPRHSRPAEDTPPRRSRRAEAAEDADAEARAESPGDVERAAVGATEPAQRRSGTRSEDGDGRRLTRARRRRHLRAAGGPRPHRPDAAGWFEPAEPAGQHAAARSPESAPVDGAEAVAQWPPVSAPDVVPPWLPADPVARRAVAPGTSRSGRHAEPEPPAVIAPPEPLASVVELADRLPADDVVDADDVVGEMAALGVDEETARARYGMTLHGLGVSVLRHLRFRRTVGLRRAPSARPYLRVAMLRCGLYLGPLGVAMAAARPLGRIGWLVPVATLVLGWSAAQALTSLGAAVARLVGGGFATVAGGWCAFVWVAPPGWLGASRMLAAVIGVGGLTALATVTAGLVTRAEAGVVRWSLPCWLLGALSVAGGSGATAGLPVETLLPAAIVVAAVRAYRPVIGRSVPRRRPLARGAVRRAVGYLVAGAGQAACVALLWRAGPAGVTAPAAIPLLLAVPALETLVGWHRYQIESALDATETGRDYRRHVRSVAVATVAALLPPLAAGIALAAAAYRLPYGATGRDGVLALAAGTLLGGLLAATLLLAARGRTGTAATLAVVAPLAILTLPSLTPTLAPLPAAVAVFAGTHLLGLLTVAHTAADHRRVP